MLQRLIHCPQFFLTLWRYMEVSVFLYSIVCHPVTELVTASVLFSAAMDSTVTAFALEAQQVLDVGYANRAGILGLLAACPVLDLRQIQEHP